MSFTGIESKLLTSCSKRLAWSCLSRKDREKMRGEPLLLHVVDTTKYVLRKSSETCQTSEKVSLSKECKKNS